MDGVRPLLAKYSGHAAAAKAWGIPLRTLASYLAGETDPKLSFLDAVCRAEGLDPSYFFVVDADFRTPDTILIPLRDVAAAAGAGMAAEGEALLAQVPVPRLLAERWGRPLGKVEAIFVKGDSMEPTIQDGAVVLIDRAERMLTEGRIFAFRTPDGLRLKRFQLGMDGAAMLVSDNKALYIPERIERSQLSELGVAGRVFWTGRMV